MKRRYFRPIKFSFVFLLIFSLLFSQFMFVASPIFAASSPWNQTDWSSGVGSSTTNQYASGSSIDATTTSGQVVLSKTEELSNTGFDSDTTSWSTAAIAPTGWVEVPGNTTYSTTNFLVMKYEAKCAATSDPTTGLTSPENSSYNTYDDTTTPCTSANSRQVVSVASGYPIANISHTNAITRCSTVSLNSTSAHLPINDEWMTIARNAEAQDTNWTGGSVGSGYLFAGHNDNAPAKARVASTTDTGDYRCAYTDTAGTTENPSSCPTNTANGTSGTAGNQVRTFSLSNGSVIWDIAGNVWEHVKLDASDTLVNNLPSDGDAAGWRWIEHTAITDYGDLSYNIVRPLGTSYDATYGMGRVYTYNGAQSNRVLLRGGLWNDTSDAGAFALHLSWTTSTTHSVVGFRCASDPVAISQSFSSSAGRASGSGNSVAVGSVADAKLYQSVNVGDTNTYDFSAYVYNNTGGSVGGTVDSSVASLYYNGSTVSTTYTSVGSGWYKLTGTITGANESREYGLLVKAGKTVVVDDFSLTGIYSTSATLTSNIFDTAYTAGAAWGTLTYTATTPTNTSVTVKARTDTSSDMSGATDFSSCTAITSGTDISGNSCVTDSHRYIQYQVSLSTSDTTQTPTFSDISINFDTYDATAPSISLTALSPDPNSDNTPSITGTATDVIGTVSTVQYQMDGTSGSWSSCTADDGTFDETSETFTCTPSALSDGAHTMYVRATDSNSNTTTNASATTDTFTIDTTAPAGINLDSPGNNSYTNADRPAFKWKATTDPAPSGTGQVATAGLSKYKLTIDNAGDSGDFTIDDIPVSRTTDYETDKYKIVYENFSDADSTNNYISVYTKSSSDWADSTNDGKLKEGKITWKVTARDNAGNETTSSRNLFVDRTDPTIDSLSMDSLGERNNYRVITNKKPTITIKATDNLSLQKLEVSLYKQSFFLGAETNNTLIETRKLNILTSATISNSFTFSPTDELSYGKYILKAIPYDTAGNTGDTKKYHFQTLSPTMARVLLHGTKNKEIVEKIRKRTKVSIPELEKKAKIRRKQEAVNLTKFTKENTKFLARITSGMATGIDRLVGSVQILAKTANALRIIDQPFVNMQGSRLAL